jgi:hypothetical protein
MIKEGKLILPSAQKSDIINKSSDAELNSLTGEKLFNLYNL